MVLFLVSVLLAERMQSYEAGPFLWQCGLLVLHLTVFWISAYAYELITTLAPVSSCFQKFNRSFLRT
jgi:hypothetical protein